MSTQIPSPGSKKTTSEAETLACNPAARQQTKPRWWRRGAGLSSALALVLSCGALPAFGNIPGGGTGSGPDVTLVNNPDGTVTMSNGIVTIVINPTNCRLTSIKYTNSTTSTTTETELSSPGYYWGGFITTADGTNTTVDYGDGTYAYTQYANNGARADVQLARTAPANIGGFVVHYTMLRGSPGFYTTAILSHGQGDVPLHVNAFGVTGSTAATFNWLTADPARNFLIGDPPTSYANHTVDAPKESNVAAVGGWMGQFDNKFLEAQDHADRKAWGFCSVGLADNGTPNPNLGVWTMTNLEYSDGGPLKRDVTSTPYRDTIAIPILTQEVGQGTDNLFAQDEQWTKVCGPFFYYINQASSSITDPAMAAQTLYSDAVAQDAAEKGAWPYSWCDYPGYVPASGRGTVTGQLTISDPDNRNPLVSGTWVGVVQQPPTSSSPTFYDFEKWLKPYQYWTQTSSSGGFTIPNVIAGSNYTLWAYGPGVAGTFLSQQQSGGSPLLEYTTPTTATPVTVTAGQTTTANLTWTPKRVGATVFELGVPDRKEDEFRHGEDFWQPETPPAVGFPTPMWGGQAYFLQEYPTSNVNYTVGTNRWDTDWNFVLPSEINSAGVYQTPSATINFNLAAAPPANAQVSLYVGVAGCNLALPQGGQSGNGIQFVMNTTPLVTGGSITAAPFTTITSAGFIPPTPILPIVPGSTATYPGNYQDNSSIHLSDHGPFLDERINFPGSALKAGLNTLTITMAQPLYSNYVGLDYLRLELAGYVPPPPAQPVVYPGNARNLVTWDVVPGAARYNVLRKGGTDSVYTSKASGVLGAVSGSDTSVMTWVDSAAVNGTAYTYEVESWNLTGGYSAASTASTAATPAASYSQAAPAVPTGVTITASGHHTATVSWTRPSGAQYYAVSRTTLGDDHNGGTNELRTIVLDDYVADPTNTLVDTTVTDGKFYDYTVSAFNAAGESAGSAPAMAHPLPPVPGAVSGLAGSATGTTSVKLTWTAAPNATGYVVYRSTTPSGQPFPFPADFRNSGVETYYNDTGLTTKTPYYYQVTAVNSAGKSTLVSASVTTN